MKLGIEQPLLESTVSVHPAVSQKWPMRSMSIYRTPVDFRSHDLFAIDGSLRDNLPVGPADEALSPKFEPIAADRFFVAHAIGSGNITTVRDCVAALNRLPPRMLGDAEFSFLARSPATRRRIKNNFCATQRGQSGGLRIPLVPANADADLAALRVPRLKAEIARRKIKFFVIKRIVRNVHLAILAPQLAVRVDDCRRVLVNARAASLEQ